MNPIVNWVNCYTPASYSFQTEDISAAYSATKGLGNMSIQRATKKKKKESRNLEKQNSTEEHVTPDYTTSLQVLFSPT